MYFPEFFKEEFSFCAAGKEIITFEGSGLVDINFGKTKLPDFNTNNSYSICFEIDLKSGLKHSTPGLSGLRLLRIR